ncbi:EAL domain-containing protein [Lacimicrobium alkaliphilum]|uniref:EAL domain-containing protein n=1 Tax=Lacimicrobium alkaliphilum TaxID=1526571 RepID=A0ABQ1R6W7_9ALTE|nr:EAL domain-containing protein [Lacimicrobium alkaliphilum]GGD58165.1 hypothetical protein GCM10011357_11910 [Lacimicrobium alkaliphilum]
MQGKSKIQGRILILDDDPLTAQTIDRIARFTGMESRFTTNHRTFFELLEGWQPDVIALDLVMPDMDGVEILSELAKKGCQTDIIITSGVDQKVLESAKRTADDSGLRILGLLAKPFSTAQLRELLGQHNAALVETSVTRPPAPPETVSPHPCLNKEALRLATERDQLCYFYQPKLHCKTGMVSGFEALARWNHPEFGWQAPSRFISEAEEQGIINSLSRYLFEQGIRWFAGLRERIATQSVKACSMLDFDQLTLSLNVSALSLSDFDLFIELRDLCQQWHINTEQVILEITESCAMENTENSLKTLTRLRVHGFQLAIDDFGTGYSSMLQLVRMPFSELKIDQSFSLNAHCNAESRAVIRSMVELSRNIGMKVVAEGIEEQSSWEFLRELGCDMVQGFLISRPLPAEQVFSWLLKWVEDVEQIRESELNQLGIDNALAQRRFDRITHLASRLLKKPIALFTVAASERIWVKSGIGIGNEVLSERGSFCSEIVRSGAPLSQEDASLDSRFSQSELVTEHGVRGYAGVPVHSPKGFVVGTLCVMATTVFSLDAAQRTKLTMLAAMLEVELSEQDNNARQQQSGLLKWELFFHRAQSTLELCQQCNLSFALVDFSIKAPVVEDNNTKAMAECVRDWLSGYCRDSDLLGQLGEYEWILLSVEHYQQSADAVSERLQNRFRQYTEQVPFTGTLRLGVATEADCSNYRLDQIVGIARQRLPT